MPPREPLDASVATDGTNAAWLASHWRPALRGMRANLLPGLILQGFALSILFGHQYVPAVREALEFVGALKERLGYTYSAVATALFGGLIPYLVLLSSGKVPKYLRRQHLVFYVGFWLWKGVEVDALYRAQAWLFGAETSPSVIIAKTAVDQFIYNPLWAAPTQTLFFLWKDSDFSLGLLRRRLRDQSLGHRNLTVLLSTWVVWIPAVAIVYCLPGALQLPLFNLVLCFWCLLLSSVSRDGG